MHLKSCDVSSSCLDCPCVFLSYNGQVGIRWNRNSQTPDVVDSAPPPWENFTRQTEDAEEERAKSARSRASQGCELRTCRASEAGVGYRSQCELLFWVSGKESEPYGPEIPCDFALFLKLKEDLRGRRFANLDLLKNEAKRLLRSYPDEFYEQVFADMVTRWKKCIAMEGGYFEGTHVAVPPEALDDSGESSDSSQDT